jgi:hypothetical protein
MQHHKVTHHNVATIKRLLRARTNHRGSSVHTPLERTHGGLRTTLLNESNECVDEDNANDDGGIDEFAQQERKYATRK